MSFKSEIRNIAYNRLKDSAYPGEGQAVPAAVDASMYSQAEDIAEAVANALHLGYVNQVNSFCTSVHQMTAALASWFPGVIDGGGPQKAAATAAVAALGIAALALKAKGTEYTNG